MSKYKCFLFDLDGTLADTFPGIFHSYQYAAKRIGISLPTEEDVGEVIGAPLAEVFRKKFKLSDHMVQNALYHYRDYYAINGLCEVKQYNGMSKMLEILKKKGYLLGVTTLKKENFAKEILKNLGIAEYFDVIIGMDDKDTLQKSQMLKRAMRVLGVSNMETVLVGDSFYDAVGAKEINIDFIATTYGFGFKTLEDVSSYAHVGVIHMPMELLNYIEN